MRQGNTLEASGGDQEMLGMHRPPLISVFAQAGKLAAVELLEGD
jgi:hypothetical protein